MPKKKNKKKITKKQKITKEMTILSVVDKYPQTANVFMSHRMHCFGCALAANETIEQGASAHESINLTKLLSDLNLAAEKKLDVIEQKISEEVKEKVKEEKPKKKSFFKRLFGRK